MKPSITIVIPVYNGERCIGRCLDSVFSSKIDVPFEVIVVDDGSTDATGLIAGKYACKLLKIKKSGVAAARNAGIRESQGEIIFFFDADVKLKEDTMEKFLRHFREDGDACVIQGRWDKRSPVPTFSSKFFLLKYAYNFNGLFNGKERIEAANLETGCLAVRREVFDRCGGFDERYKFSGGEEFELGIRIMEKFKIFYYSDIFVEHAFGGIFKTFWKIYRRTINFSILTFANNNKNYLYLHRNSVPVEDKRSMVILLLLLFSLAAGLFYFEGGLISFGVLTAAYFVNFFKFLRYIGCEEGPVFAVEGAAAYLVIMLPRLFGALAAAGIFYVIGKKDYKI